MNCPACGFDTGADSPKACRVCRARAANKIIKFAALGFALGLGITSVKLFGAETDGMSVLLWITLPPLGLLFGAGVGYWQSNKG